MRRFLSRISIRLMAFNLLLVFVPVAGIIYLGSYEATLLAGQRRALHEEARLLSATLTTAFNPEAAVEEIFRQRAALVRSRPIDPVRLRVISLDGEVLADSREASAAASPEENSPRRHILYRAGAGLLKPILGFFRTSELALGDAEAYERAPKLLGYEVRMALEGRSASNERISPDRRSVTVYVAEPIRRDGRIVGAVLASQSTFAILQGLYTVRLGIVRIFALSILVAIILSLLVATTIVRPLRQLRVEAGAMLDRSGRLRGRFHGLRKQDEIGDLSRALEGLTGRLDERVRFIESFAADVSHEFKNPLASIRTATEMLAEVEEPAQRRRFLRMVEQEIARMESLLAGVREISLIDAQLSTENRQRVELNGLLARIVEGFQLRAGDRVEIRFQPAPAPCEVEASEDRLIQVFVNILENALSFSPAGGAITIAVQSADRTVAVAISDQGPGIPESNLQKVFDRFFTHRPDTTKVRRTHTGLGLAIVKAIVTGHGGTITAANNPEGGARFEIRLPLAS